MQRELRQPSSKRMRVEERRRASEQHCRQSSMMKSEYQRSGMILRNRSGRRRGSSPQSNPFAHY